MNIKQVKSPNYTKGRGGNNVNQIIIHWMVGTLAGTDALFQRNSGVSAHYGIENKSVHQYVSESDTAWHCGDFATNQRSVGIEHSAAPGRSPSADTYESSAKLVAQIARRHGIQLSTKTVRPHLAVTATRCSGTNTNGTVREAGGVDINRIIKRANEILGKSTPKAPANPKPKAPANTPIRKGDVVTVVNPVDYNGVRLGVSGSYIVMEVRGDRVVIGRNNQVTAAIRASNLSKAGSGTTTKPKPKPIIRSIGVGSTVRVTNPVDWNGTRLGVSGNYTVIELRGNRAVIGRGGQVTAAIHKNNLRRV